MELDLIALLDKSAPLLIFLNLFLGYVVGKITIGSFQIGSTTGVLLVGLVFGHFGFSAMAGLDTIGFILFIFCVGLQTGPRFFSVFLEDGAKYIGMAAIVALSAIVITLLLSHLQGISAPMSAGIMAGSLTSTPALIGAQDAIRNMMSGSSEGMQMALSDIGVGYALTYILGTVGLLLMINYTPALLGVDLKKEAKKVAVAKGLEKNIKKHTELPIVRVFRLDEERIGQFEGKTLRQMALQDRTGCLIDKIRRNGSIFEPDGDTALVEGDSIALVGRPREIYKFPYELGQETFDSELLDYEFGSQEVVVINPQIAGMRLQDVGIDALYGCFVSKVSRSQIEMPINDDLQLCRGDVLEISGEKGRLERLTERLGYADEQSHITDVVTFTFGIVAGLLIGHLIVKIGSIDITLGNAGGLLLSGISIGHMRSNYPTFGRVPPAATYVLMELGLMLFMANIGLSAGDGIVNALMNIGPMILLSGMIIMIVPVMTGYLFGHYVLKLNVALLLGALTGARTSTAALNILTEEAKSNVPALSYAGTYAFANVFMTLAGTILVNMPL
ncbi:aspartate-alanine antiporter-like transporter [Endozoicomonas euniceicola]|uniref:RCK C-terminal domain-containing protein n=1 Tax=Endozoicomonas euniceicola TaxID=1234143 RepID=A0ABY6GVR5_9GAMM|nr:TrkA C-terminal domain-containing protein [Endozoicomonas euniceicola]UYM16852.1 hypothetical protein NX720_02695 [Endozoicomonas euniceicola]